MSHHWGYTQENGKFFLQLTDIFQVYAKINRSKKQDFFQHKISFMLNILFPVISNSFNAVCIVRTV